jgi:hypothetical protein
MDTQFKSEEVRESGHLENVIVDEDNIRMNLKEIWWEDVNWIHVADDRNHWRTLVGIVMNLTVHGLLCAG